MPTSGGYPISARVGYPGVMKTTIDVDRETANEAAEVLGTTTLKDTVNAALLEVVKAERRRKLAQAVRDGTLSVPTVEEHDALNAPQVPIGFFDRDPDE